MGTRRKRVVARPLPKVRSRAEQQRKPAKFTERLQALCALAATIATVWTVVLVQKSLDQQQQINRSQLEINRSQLEMNQILQQRDDHRYAARVTWWKESAHDQDLLIQNRSPAALSDVQIGDRTYNYPDGATNLSLSDVPPCSVVAVRVGDANSSLHFLDFTDPVGRWEMSANGFQKIDISNVYPITFPVHFLYVRNVEDCGEAG